MADEQEIEEKQEASESTDEKQEASEEVEQSPIVSPTGKVTHRGFYPFGKIGKD